GMTRDRHFRIVDVLMATTAAPTYFPHSCISPGSAYCDGGLWANNPSAVAIAEASRISMECKRPEIDPVFGPTDVWMLSLGTGSTPYDVAPPGDERDGLLFWGTRAYDVMAASQSQ
ncbi:MAG: hypothetical protein L6Q92_16980, partial [Phycisphaerae bacterium]|nr:hypothetical protein [Phycisphaerae bacterium]